METAKTIGMAALGVALGSILTIIVADSAPVQAAKNKLSSNA